MNAWEEMIVASVRFAVWAAGEGLAPIGGPQGPEDFLYIFSERTGHEDWDSLDKLAREYLRSRTVPLPNGDRDRG
jgi:hypothetical protein